MDLCVDEMKMGEMGVKGILILNFTILKLQNKIKCKK